MPISGKRKKAGLVQICDSLEMDGQLVAILQMCAAWWYCTSSNTNRRSISRLLEMMSPSLYM
jgi:hypothetical protein